MDTNNNKTKNSEEIIKKIIEDLSKEADIEIKDIINELTEIKKNIADKDKGNSN